MINIIPVFRSLKLFAQSRWMTGFCEFGFQPGDQFSAFSGIGASFFLGRHFPEGDLFQGLAPGLCDGLIGKVRGKIF